MQFDNERPIYQQIAQDLKYQIVRGTLPEGGRLPSVRGLCAQYGVTSLTAQRALAQLEADNVCETKKGIGRFVRSGMRANLSRSQRYAATRQYVGQMRSMGQTDEQVRAAIDDALRGG